jgi:hypothetical protein
MKTPRFPLSGRVCTALLLIVFSVFMMSAASRAADPDVDLTGTYRCKGPTYEGSVTISRQGDSYRVNWTIGRERYAGVGLVQGDVLAVAYYGEMRGIVAYRIEDASHLVGRWTTVANPSAVSTETLTK